MNEKYVNSIQNIHIIALYLHPNYKSLSLLQQEPLKSVFSDFDVQQALQDYFPSAFEVDEPEQKQAKSDDPANLEVVSDSEIENSKAIMTSDDELMDSSGSTNDPILLEKSISDEIIEYQQMKPGKFSDPIEFWKGSNLSKLKKIALFTFSATSSSAEPERHNSHAGLTITDLRNQLNFETVESLVLYKTFMKL